MTQTLFVLKLMSNFWRITRQNDIFSYVASRKIIAFLCMLMELILPNNCLINNSEYDQIMMYFNTHIHVTLIHVSTEAQKCVCIFELFVVCCFVCYRLCNLACSQNCWHLPNLDHRRGLAEKRNNRFVKWMKYGCVVVAWAMFVRFSICRE